VKKNTLFLMFILVFSFLIMACCNVIKGSGKIETKSYDLKDFVEVEISNQFEVDIIKADTFKVEIKADDNVFNHLDVSVIGNKLRLRSANDTKFINCTLKAQVNMPTIESLDVSGISKCEFVEFKADNFIAKVLGASTIKGSISATNVELNAEGASKIEIKGNAENVNIESFGASTIDIKDFYVKKAMIDISGASNTTISAEEEIKGKVSGASALYYYGNPTVNVDATGASNIVKKD